jgi:hypothetical protein
MPQIFHRSFNTISKVSILGFVFILAFLGWVVARLARSDYVTGAWVYRDQPVPFSHQHHVSGLGIDCRYCHTAVEEAPYAGLPPTRTCLNCHSQIWTQSPLLEPVRASYRSDASIPWVRVHNLAGFVYFDHSIHIHKGIGCVSCHGRVDRMPLTTQVVSLQMEWCLECHRQPERHVRPREKVFDLAWEPPPQAEDLARLGRELGLEPPPQTVEELRQALARKYQVRSLTSCSTCHR